MYVLPWRYQRLRGLIVPMLPDLISRGDAAATTKTAEQTQEKQGIWEL
ncbi:MAG: hypothetical protein WBA89_02615 [Microcoleus sp.]